jgi:predicted membrane protein
MPLISRTFIKAGMVFFALSLITSLLIELNVAALPGLIPLFWHMLMVGWITQIIFGVSIWMFPGRNRDEGFKAQLWGWLTFIFLNTGLTLRVISEPMAGVTATGIWNILLLLSAFLQVLAVTTYLIEMWPRIMSKKQQRKKRKRQRKRSKERGSD